jgi:hypothetical protein
LLRTCFSWRWKTIFVGCTLIYNFKLFFKKIYVLFFFIVILAPYNMVFKFLSDWIFYRTSSCTLNINWHRWLQFHCFLMGQCQLMGVDISYCVTLVIGHHMLFSMVLT